MDLRAAENAVRSDENASGIYPSLDIPPSSGHSNAESDSAHEDDESRRAPRPRWGANGAGKLAWDAVESDGQFINFIHHRQTASNQNCMPKPDFQRDLTSAHVYLLHKTTKNRASIQGVVRLLDPELCKLSDSALKKRLARTVTRFEESKRNLQRCTDTQREDFFGRHLSNGIPDKPMMRKPMKRSKKKKNSGAQEATPASPVGDALMLVPEDAQTHYLSLIAAGHEKRRDLLLERSEAHRLNAARIGEEMENNRQNVRFEPRKEDQAKCNVEAADTHMKSSNINDRVWDAWLNRWGLVPVDDQKALDDILRKIDLTGLKDTKDDELLGEVHRRLRNTNYKDCSCEIEAAFRKMELTMASSCANARRHSNIARSAEDASMVVEYYDDSDDAFDDDTVLERTFERGAMVRGLPWTDGGGDTARIYGEGIAFAYVDSGPVIKCLSNGRKENGYVIMRSDSNRKLFYPGRLLIQACKSGLSDYYDTRHGRSTKGVAEMRQHLQRAKSDADSQRKLLAEVKASAAKELAEQKDAASKKLEQARKTAREEREKDQKEAKKQVETAARAREAKLKRQLEAQKSEIEKMQRKNRKLESRSFAINANLEEISERNAKLSERNAKLQKQKNKANELKRKEMKKNSRLQKRVESLKSGSSGEKPRAQKLRKDVRDRIESSQADAIAAEMRLESLEDEIEGLQDHVKVIEEKIGKNSKGRLLPDLALLEASKLLPPRPKATINGGKRKRKANKKAEEREAERSEPPEITLLEVLGQTGELYSQDMIELGLTLMAAQLTAPQAVAVMRAFIRVEYPTKKEGVDYRIPDASRFREWRRYLEPISHYIGLSVLKMSTKAHLMHDATTKNHIHVYQTCFRCEVEGDDGETIVVDVPLKFEICPHGTAKAEADLTIEAMTKCGVADKPAVSMVNVASSSSDGAARATSRELGKRKQKELAEVQKLVDDDYNAYPEKYQAAVEAYLSLSDEQREVADEFHELGCSGHALNLIVDSSWKKSEKDVVKVNRANHGDCLDDSSEAPDPSNVVTCTSKLFAAAGKHWECHLNEHRRVEKYARDGKHRLRRLPPVRGSRQCINVQLATAILANKATYLNYLSKVRADADPNKLVKVVWDGLSDKYVVAALRARSYVDVMYGKTMTFFTHASSMNRLMLRTAVDCGGKFIEELSEIDDNRPNQPLGSLGSNIITALLELAKEDNAVMCRDVYAVKQAYNSWWNDEEADLMEFYAECTNTETWSMVAEHLKAASPHMLATHNRDCNIDEDHSKDDSLRHAPINTDVVESGFALLDDALKIKASIKGTIGVAHAKALKAFTTDGEKAQKAKQKAANSNKKGVRSGSLSQEANALQAQWDVTSFFNMPREKRWEIIKSVQKNYKELCVSDPLARLEDHDEAALERARQARVDEINKARKRYFRYKQMEVIEVVKSVAQLRKLFSSFSCDDNEGRNQAMIDQIRVRIHVYGVKRSQLPKMHEEGVGDEANAKRLLTELESSVVKKLPPKPSAPAPFPERPCHVAPTKEAQENHRDYLQEFNQVWKEVTAMTTSGSFIAPKKKSTSGGLGGAKRQRRSRVEKERPARDDEAALVGEEFEEDGTEWKVLAVDYSCSVERMVVWYYDVGGTDLPEEEIERMRIEGKEDEMDFLEFSTVAEVKAWVQACGKMK